MGVTSKLYEKGANKRIFNIDNHVGMVTWGLYADARQLAETASNEASNYRQDYGSAVPTEFLANRISMYMHAYTLYSAVRPYGSTIMLGSWTEIAGPKLFASNRLVLRTDTGAVLPEKRSKLQKLK